MTVEQATAAPGEKRAVERPVQVGDEFDFDLGLGMTKFVITKIDADGIHMEPANG